MEQSKSYTTLAVHLFNLLPSAKPSDKLVLGLGQDVCSRITKLSSEEIHRIASRASRYLHVEIDRPVLEQLISDVANDTEDSEMQDEFIYNCATSKMMHEFFGMHTTEFVARRKSLGMVGQGQHRPKYCSEQEETVIWKMWKKFENIEIRERYLKVAETTGQPLNIIYPAIQRYQG